MGSPRKADAASRYVSISLFVLMANIATAPRLRFQHAELVSAPQSHRRKVFAPLFLKSGLFFRPLPRCLQASNYSQSKIPGSAQPVSLSHRTDSDNRKMKFSLDSKDKGPQIMPHEERFTPFPTVMVISLNKASDRRKTMSKRLMDMGIEFEFLTAVDGNCLTSDQLGIYNGRQRRIFFGKDLYPGEIGCLLSHKIAIEKIAASSREAIILEDDAVLSEDFKYVVRELLAHKEDWELVRFFGDKKHSTRLQRKIVDLGKGYWLTRLSTTPGGAHAYLLNQSGARKLLRQLEHTSTPIDTLMGQSWKTGISTLSVYPGIAHADSHVQSQIGDERFDEKPNTVGFEKLIFPIARPSLRLIYNILKRLCYYGAVPIDMQRRVFRRTPQKG